MFAARSTAPAASGLGVAHVPAAQAPVAGARVAGVAGYRPRRVVGNAELAAGLGVTASWIERRLGVRRRRFAGYGESVVDMAVAAAAKALATAGRPASSVDLVVACQGRRSTVGRRPS